MGYKFVSKAEQKVQEAKAKLDGVRERLDRLQREQNELIAMAAQWESILQHWQDLLSQEAKPAQAAGAVAAQQTGPALPQPQIADDGEEDGDNKTRIVRDYVYANGERGADPAELKREAKRIGLEHPPSWPYGALSRLKKRGLIIKRKGRFYPATAQDGAPPLMLVG